MDSNDQLISIILPTYNGEKFISQSIESCLRQTHKNIELIIIDDCSTDNTSEIVKEYLKKDSRIIYYRNEINLKLPTSLNKGFSLSKGDYLTWTSDDNYYADSALETLLKGLKQNPDCDLSYSSYTFVNEKNNVLDMFNYTTSHLLFKCIIGGCFLYTRKLYEETGDYNVHKFRMEDYDYWLRSVTRFKLHYINKPELYYYRKHTESLTAEIYRSENFFEEYKENYRHTFQLFFNEYMKAGFSEEDLQIHVKIFFNEVMKVNERGEIRLYDIDKVFGYFNKISSLPWEKSNFDKEEVKKVVEEVRARLLTGIINNMMFLNGKLTGQNPKLAGQYGKSISWYYKEYEVLPGWYKKIGHIIKAFQGNRTWKSLIRKEEEKK